MLPTNGLLVRILVAKVTNDAGLCTLLASVPMRPEVEGWTCVSWLQEALEAAVSAEPGVLGTVADGGWRAIRDKAQSYADGKVGGHRFDGQGQFPFGDVRLPPTWDMLQDKEVLP